MSRVLSLKVIVAMICFASSLCGQKIDPILPSQTTAFQGLKKTKVHYLLDILKPEIDSPTPLRKIQQDLITLKNLPSIAHASYTIDTLPNTIHVTYHIEERKTALPIINFGGIKDNVWFSAGFIENNFRGRGDLLIAYYQNNNGRHAGQVFYRKPRIIGSDWGYSASIHKWSSQEPVFFAQGTVQYYYDNNGVGLSLLRNIGLRNRIELGGTYFIESYEKTSNQILENPPGPENFSIHKYLTKLQIKSTYLEYDFFYLSGFETILNYQHVLNFDDKSGFNSLQWQGRMFLRPSDRLNLAFRLKLAVSTNEDTPFAPFVADSHVNIRGIGNRIDRGTAQAVLNIEARYTVFHHQYWSSQIVAFADNGTWRNPGGSLRDIFDSSQFRQFVGLGFRVNYQKVFGATLRVDYGVDLYNVNQKGVVIGLGQYF